MKRTTYRVAIGDLEAVPVRARSPERAIERIYAEAGITPAQHDLTICQVWSGDTWEATTKRRGEIAEYWQVKYNL